MITEEQWIEGAQDAVKIATMLQPLIAAGSPGFGIGLNIFVKVVQGAIDNEPKAKALIEQIKTGTIPTAAELHKYSVDYESAYQKLHDDIAKKLAGG